MELEELKAAWSSFDERLQKQEIIKESIVKEMLYTKSDRALNKLVNFDIFGIVVTLLVIPFIVYILSRFHYQPMHRIMLYIVLVLGSIGVIGQIWKTITLLKVDFSKDIASNLHLIQRYNIYIGREKIVSYIILTLVVAFTLFPIFAMGMEVWRWIAIISMLLCGFILVFWQYKKIYDKNIKLIMKSLDEIKELE